MAAKFKDLGSIDYGQYLNSRVLEDTMTSFGGFASDKRETQVEGTVQDTLEKLKKLDHITMGEFRTLESISQATALSWKLSDLRNFLRIADKYLGPKIRGSNVAFGDNQDGTGIL